MGSQLGHHSLRLAVKEANTNRRMRETISWAIEAG